MAFQVNVHDRVNRTLNPSSSAILEPSSKTNSGAKDVSILLRESVEVVNRARREIPLPANSREERRKVMPDSKFQEPPTTPLHHVGNKFHEVIQLKKGGYADLPDAMIAEIVKSNSLDKAPTQSLLSVVSGILDESVEQNNREIPYHVACLLRKVAQEIERRIVTQAEHLRMQSGLFKAREEKYKARIEVLEAIAAATCEESNIVSNQLQQIKNEVTTMEEKAKIKAQDVFRFMKEKDDSMKEIVFLKEELEVTRKTYEHRCLQIESEARSVQNDLEERLKVANNLLTESTKRIRELETITESKVRDWNRKEHIYRIFTKFQLGALQDLRLASQSIRQEVVKTQNIYTEEFVHLGGKVHALEDAARNYYDVLAENQKLHNEVQDLRGNIRVYCRIRPFLPEKEERLSTIEYIGENGELTVVNPSKTGKEASRLFRFNKVYGPSSTQDEVFSDIQPLVQSVLDGYNVCIFAYGQTGSGKTYTMMGPYGATEEQCGVNYRALNDLFHISQTRESTFTYEIGVQMVEIYNEQVRDLLSSSSSQKKLGILSTIQPNGLAVPDASMYTVNSTSDVFELMDIGLKNRAQGSTILNERSSRSHSIVTIHVRGTDLKTGSLLKSSLHLVDLAGSERVDRSEVTGDRLKEALYINKSLSALGDVIFALAQKSSHVPYRNSKLTQVLQSSLGGRAKTLMFVQLNPDTSSYSETVSTLKFAERVSGVELGTAKNSKDGRDVRELTEQVATLKNTVARKKEEIERLQLLRDPKIVYFENGCVKQFPTSVRCGSSSSSSSPTKHFRSDTVQGNLFDGEDSGLEEIAITGQDNFSEGSSEQHSDVNSQNHDNDVVRRCKELEYPHQQKVNTTAGGNAVHSSPSNAERLGFRGNAENEKRLSNASNSDQSVGMENVDFNKSKSLSCEGAKTSKRIERRPNTASRIPRASPRSPMDSPKASTGLRKSSSGTTLSTKSSRRWQ